MNDIEIKIDNLELFDTVKTYLFINLPIDISDYNLELFSNDNKLILNNNIENNTLSVNNIITIQIQPFIQYFLKINYRKINNENTILSWHKFISDKPEDDIEMIIHKKNNNINNNNINNNNNNFIRNNFFENNLSNFIFDNCEESENIDEEEVDSEDSDNINNLESLSKLIQCNNTYFDTHDDNVNNLNNQHDNLTWVKESYNEGDKNNEDDDSDEDNDDDECDDSNEGDEDNDDNEGNDSNDGDEGNEYNYCDQGEEARQDTEDECDYNESEGNNVL